MWPDGRAVVTGVSLPTVNPHWLGVEKTTSCLTLDSILSEQHHTPYSSFRITSRSAGVVLSRVVGLLLCCCCVWYHDTMPPNMMRTLSLLIILIQIPSVSYRGIAPQSRLQRQVDRWTDGLVHLGNLPSNFSEMHYRNVNEIPRIASRGPCHFRPTSHTSPSSSVLQESRC